MSRILYQERMEWQNQERETVNWIEVQVRSWACEGMIPDVVIHSRVHIDTERVRDDRETFSHLDADAKFIRWGINRFDLLVQEFAPKEAGA